MKILLPEDHNKLINGFCPGCGSAFLIPGPRGGSARNVLCGFCRTEFVASLVQSHLLASPCDPARQKEVYWIPTTAERDNLPLHHKPTFVFTEENQIRADALRFAADILVQAAAGGTGATVAMLRKAANTYEHLFNAERETK